MNVRVSLAVGVSMLVLVSSLGGCSKKAPDKPNPQNVQGTWIELAEATQSSRRMTPVAPRPFLRQITFNADKTFKMVQCDKEGKPVAGNKTIEGTWVFQDGTLNFTVTANKFDAQFQSWKPQSSGGVMGFYSADRTSVEERLSVTHEDAPVTYKRAAG